VQAVAGGLACPGRELLPFSPFRRGSRPPRAGRGTSTRPLASAAAAERYDFTARPGRGTTVDANDPGFVEVAPPGSLPAPRPGADAPRSRRFFFPSVTITPARLMESYEFAVRGINFPRPVPAGPVTVSWQLLLSSSDCEGHIRTDAPRRRRGAMGLSRVGAPEVGSRQANPPAADGGQTQVRPGNVRTLSFGEAVRVAWRVPAVRAALKNPSFLTCAVVPSPHERKEKIS